MNNPVNHFSRRSIEKVLGFFLFGIRELFFSTSQIHHKTSANSTTSSKKLELALSFYARKTL